MGWIQAAAERGSAAELRVSALLSVAEPLPSRPAQTPRPTSMSPSGALELDASNKTIPRSGDRVDQQLIRDRTGASRTRGWDVPRPPPLRSEF